MLFPCTTLVTQSVNITDISVSTSHSVAPVAIHLCKLYLQSMCSPALQCCCLFVMPVTFTCPLFSFAKLSATHQWWSTDRLSSASRLSASSSSLIGHFLCLSARPADGFVGLSCLLKVADGWSYSIFFQTLFIHLPDPVHCLPPLHPPCLGFQSSPAPTHPLAFFSVTGLYLPVIWLVCLTLAALQSAKSSSHRQGWRIVIQSWLQYGTTTCWISDVFVSRYYEMKSSADQ